MHIRVLGPIQVAEAGQDILLTGQRQRALIGGLVLDLGKVVPMARLIDTLWSINPPKSARTKLQGYVSAIRRQFRSAGLAGDEVLVTRPPGYQLRRDGVWTDLDEFKELSARGQAALEAGDARAASDMLRAALALWRGQPFADVSSEVIRAAADGIDDRRVLAIEAKAEADLLVGRSSSVAADLREWLSAYPLRERLRGYCMLAAYRQGCRADALNLFREGRAVMVAELGVEPGPELRALHQRMLRDDPGLQVAHPRTVFETIARSRLTGPAPSALRGRARGRRG